MSANRKFLKTEDVFEDNHITISKSEKSIECFGQMPKILALYVPKVFVLDGHIVFEWEIPKASLKDFEILVDVFFAKKSKK
jgi:hypothetical protein